MPTATSILPESVKIEVPPLEVMVSATLVKVDLRDPNFIVTQLFPLIREISGYRPFHMESRQFVMENGQTRSEIKILFDNGSTYSGCGESILPAYATLAAFSHIIPEIERTYQFYPAGHGWGV